MTRMWFALLLSLLFAPAIAQAERPGTAAVTARLTPEGIHASVTLDRAVTRFAFAQADVVREGDFELLTPGLVLAGNTVTAPKPFRRFELRIRPMSKQRDAKYPAHYRIGEGGVLYAPALTADPAGWRTRLSFKLNPGQIRAPSTGDVTKGFVFIGPAALRSEHDKIVVIADPKTPPWLVERTRTDLAAAVSAFTSDLKAPLPRKPVLIVKHEGGGRNSNVGDVTPGAVTALRFQGDAWTKPNAMAAKNIQSFVLHEAFHFWNGGLASPAENTPTWLHEGAAEYASLLGGLKAGVLTHDDVRKRLGDALQRCRFGLQDRGDKSLTEVGFLSSQLRYPCGMVLQWAADLHLRKRGSTIMDAWEKVIRIARQKPSDSYGLADFYAAAGIASGETFGPVRLLAHQGGAERWEALPAALNELGAEVEQAPSPAGRRGALLFHLLRQNCKNLPEGSSIGFFFDEQSVKLDSPSGCGALAGDPSIKTLEGGDLLELTADTYAVVQRKCAANEPVLLTTADSRTLSAACAKPLPPEPKDYAVKRWLPPTETQ